MSSKDPACKAPLPATSSRMANVGLVLLLFPLGGLCMTVGLLWGMRAGRKEQRVCRGAGVGQSSPPREAWRGNNRACKSKSSSRSAYGISGASSPSLGLSFPKDWTRRFLVLVLCSVQLRVTPQRERAGAGKEQKGPIFLPGCHWLSSWGSGGAGGGEAGAGSCGLLPG